MFQSMKEVLVNLVEKQPTSEEALFLKDKVSLHCFPKNQIIFYQQDESHKLYILKEGLVVLNRHNHDGELSYHEMVVPNVLFPMNSLCCYENNHYEAVALTKSVLWQIKRTDLLLFLERFPKYYPVFCRDLSLMNERSEEKIYMLTSMNAKERVFSVIETLLADFGITKSDRCFLPWPITVIEISQLAKVTRETTSLVLNELKDEKKVLYANKQLAIPL